MRQFVNVHRFLSFYHPGVVFAYKKKAKVYKRLLKIADEKRNITKRRIRRVFRS